jgi:hypothetical protein
LIAIAAIIYLLVTGEQEIAIYASMLAIPWIGVTILAFLLDYFVILSEKAIKKSFSNNILKRVNKIGKNYRESLKGGKMEINNDEAFIKKAVNYSRIIFIISIIQNISLILLVGVYFLALNSEKK